MDVEYTEFDDVPKIKIVFLGDRSVGKSSIVKRFIRDEFDVLQNPTIGIDYMSKLMEYRGKQYKLELWDTAGQEKYRSLVKNYLKDADCALFIYDVNDARTYKHVADWLRTFRQATNRESVCLVVGNKIDIDQQRAPMKSDPSSPEIRQLQHFEVSAKLGTNITFLFRRVIELIVARNILSKRFLPESTKLIRGVSSRMSRCCSSE